MEDKNKKPAQAAKPAAFPGRGRVAIVKCGTYDGQEVQIAVQRAVEHLGGLERVLSAGEKPLVHDSRIILKPNLLAKTEPEKACTTHPAVFKAVGALLQENGYKKSSTLIREHCDRVLAICKKLDLKPMMWSDMYITSNTGGGYYEVPENADCSTWEKPDATYVRKQHCRYVRNTRYRKYFALHGRTMVQRHRWTPFFRVQLCLHIWDFIKISTRKLWKRNLPMPQVEIWRTS